MNEQMKQHLANGDLSTLNPSEIDALWLEAAQPGNRLRDRRNQLRSKAAKYRKWGGHYAKQADGYDAEADALYQEILDADVALEPFQAEWQDRGGWTRAYLVPDGHIHRSTACSSLHPTTLIAWLPEQSGWDEDEIVAAAGVHACTICYPTAPVEALRAAEMAAKAALECPGSREYAPGPYGRRYRTCPQCNTTQSVTSSGKFRAHKKAEVPA